MAAWGQQPVASLVPFWAFLLAAWVAGCLVVLAVMLWLSR